MELASAERGVRQVAPEAVRGGETAKPSSRRSAHGLSAAKPREGVRAHIFPTFLPRTGVARRKARDPCSRAKSGGFDVVPELIEQFGGEAPDV